MYKRQVRILSEPKNALTRQYQKLFELDNVKLEFTREALEEIAQLAVDRKIGARGLRSILETVMMDLMYEIPSDDTIGICTITKGVVDKTGQPEPVSYTHLDVYKRQGMPGTNNLREHQGLREAIERANKQGRRVAAICAAPSVLGAMGLLKGRTATCYPGFEEQLTGVSYTSQGVVTDGNITTGRGLGYALDLGLELIRLLQGPQQAQKIAAAIQYSRG